MFWVCGLPAQSTSGPGPNTFIAPRPGVGSGETEREQTGNNMKRLLLIAARSLPASAFAWGTAGLAYMNPQQPQPQPSYSQQYNAGYNDAHMNAHGYAAQNGYGPAYQDGYNAAWKAEHRQ